MPRDSNACSRPRSRGSRDVTDSQQYGGLCVHPPLSVLLGVQFTEVRRNNETKKAGGEGYERFSNTPFRIAWSSRRPVDPASLDSELQDFILFEYTHYKVETMSQPNKDQHSGNGTEASHSASQRNR